MDAFLVGLKAFGGYAASASTLCHLGLFLATVSIFAKNIADTRSFTTSRRPVGPIFIFDRF